MHNIEYIPGTVAPFVLSFLPSGRACIVAATQLPRLDLEIGMEYTISVERGAHFIHLSLQCHEVMFAHGRNKVRGLREVWISFSSNDGFGDVAS